MNNQKILNIKGAVLDQNQLENYLEKIASDHIITMSSQKNTYPIPRLKENFQYITNIYNLLNEHIKLGIAIHPAGEWILDNFYIIENSVKMIVKELTLKKYMNFLGISNGTYKGFARIYVLAEEIVAYTDGQINEEKLVRFLTAYQNKKTLNMDEIWKLGIFMQISLIEKIRGICEKIYSSQMQKYTVENIIERLVENKQKPTFKNNINGKMLGYGQMKYPFIEYMSYRLKSYGKKAYGYMQVLEEQVEKMGTDIYDVIKKEHFDIAVKKISLGNAITSINIIMRMNFQLVFEQINGVEEILKLDPVNVYDKMDYKTKSYYRNVIEKISNQTKISEIYIAKKCLELAQKNNISDITNKNETTEKTIQLNNIEHQRKSHIGYYLIDKGKDTLLSELLNKPIKNKSDKTRIYVGTVYACTLVIATLIAIIIKIQISKSLTNLNSCIISILISILLIVPIQNIIVQIINYLLSKIVKPKLIPKLDFQNGIPFEYSTMVVIPTIVKNKEKVADIFKNLEIFYIANKSENLYFTLLGDCSSGKSENEIFDNEVIQEGIEQAKRLNEKYKSNIPKFNFIYRKRNWNASEECYLGWERKRGLLNQFNEFILGKIKNPFSVSTFENNDYSNIKYIITLDSDTELVLNTGFELIGAMAHILNQPVLNKNRNHVVYGHGIIQPRIGINLEACRKSVFTKIYAGSGGIDSYTNATSDVYQDNFGEGIFTGKGIYDLKAFSTILKDRIPENAVLSHDLLEGCHLRCGLASDVMLMDGYPTSYIAFKTRLHRWIRGDYQIINWMKNKDINFLSKFKIFDNLVRSQCETFSVLLILIVCILNLFLEIKIWPIVVIAIVSNVIPTILEILNKIVCKKDGQKVQKTFSKVLNGVKASFIRAIIAIAVLPDKANISTDAAIRTLYRMYKSKKHLLEWTTAEEVEKNAKTSLKAYYQNMGANVILGVLGIFYFTIKNYNRFILNETYLILVISILWLIAPYIMFQISKLIKPKELDIELVDREYLLEIAKRTWMFFKENLNEQNNFLPPDNYQEDRKPKLIRRTSPTNIGLAILAVISSYDLKFEALENTLNTLEKMVNIIESLPKWNGHLYNWYDIETLKPVVPQYISSVDSGNFVGYLYVLRQFLLKYCSDNLLVDRVEKIIQDANFSKLYNEKNRLFSIGYNVEENKLTDSYYDLLASEARQTSLIAIAKKDISSKHWYNLGRTLTVLNNYKGLVSWSGTGFEYLMPCININQYQSSLLDESTKFMIMSQKEYCKRLDVPWGISESAFNLKDLNNNYQYKAFGIPWLGLKRGLGDEIVVSSYGSVMGLSIVNNGDNLLTSIIKNIRWLENEGMLGKYGLYEAIDFTPNRLEKGKKSAIVKTYMAHHQGLILASINNLFNNKIFQKRFMDNLELKAVDILLQERMPEDVIITKEKKEKIEKIKYKDFENYSERVYNNPNSLLEKINLISNNNYSIIINQKGEGYSKYKDKILNRFKQTEDYAQGIFFYIKNVKNKKIWTSGYLGDSESPEKYTVSFMPDKSKFVRVDGAIETSTQITIGINEPVEIRKMELTNNGNNEEMLEITSSIEPVLSTQEQDFAHRAFNNMFLKMEYLDENNILLVKRKARKSSDKDLFMGVKLCTQGEVIGDYEFEINKEKFFGRGNFLIPKAVIFSKPFSKKIGLTTDPIVAIKRNVKINPKEKVVCNLIICVSEDKNYIIDIIEKYSNFENVKRNFELSKARVQEETRYLQLVAKDIELFQRILPYLLFKNPLKGANYQIETGNDLLKIENLWKYGISGDLPILLVKIKNINDIKTVEEMINAYEFYRAKNLEIDLVILNEEKQSYENYVNEAIQDVIYNKNIQYLQNIRAGIFVLKNVNNDEKLMLEQRANICFDSHLGNVSMQLDEMEEAYLEKYKINVIDMGVSEELKIGENKLKLDELKYYNEYGGFSEDGKEYKIKVTSDRKLPTVWSHIMANENFGTLTTESLGGYTWIKNSKLNRLTALSNDQILDTPSEIIFMQDKENEKMWSIGSNFEMDNNDYYITYGFGYAKYNHCCNNIEQELEIFVPVSEQVKVNIIHLKNLLPKKRKLNIFYCIKPVLGEDEIKTQRFIKCELSSQNNCVFMKNIINFDYNNIAYVTSSEKIIDIKNCKINNNILELNEVFERNNVIKSGINLKFGNYIKCQMEVELEAFENKDFCIILGAEDTILDCQDKSYKYSNLNNCNKEYESIKKYWKDLVNKVQVQTPLDSMNIMLNGWAIYQTLSSRLLGRTGFYQSGGAYGFRDQLQDCICLKYFKPELVKNQIIKHSKHQFIEGDVEHWWHEETGRGIRTRFSDDLLWFPYLVIEYIEYTGDYSILDVETPYITGKLLLEGIDENYDRYVNSGVVESIYMHCIRAIEKSFDFGKNGLPKIGSGDWNDGFSTVGNHGKGESVWLGFFLCSILGKFLKILETRQKMYLFSEDVIKNEQNRINEYKIIVGKLKKSLNTAGWDGRWFRRAYMDNGDVLGSIENDECRIDSIAQSWAVISNIGDNDKKYISMESLENHLIDTENGIIKLLDPPFENGKFEPGYIKSYIPGTRENGGQYTHAAIWVIIAEAMLGFGNKAIELFRMINPIEHSRTKTEAEKYKVEPYVISADVYGQLNLAGRGGWTWYTGSSSWFYEAGLKYILGLQIKNEILKINPCIPNQWKEYSIRLNYGDSIYNIKVKNLRGKSDNKDVEKFICNGTEIAEKQIKLDKSCGINEIEIIV